MKKVIFLLSILCLIPSIIFAQNKSKKKSAKSDKIKLICSQEPMPSTGVGYGISSDSQAAATQFDTPVKLIYKPNAVWTDSALRAANLQGTVILRIQFLSNCKIGQIQLVKGLPYGLSESSIDAARKIIFQPALKNGKPVTVTKPIEYPFTIH